MRRYRQAADDRRGRDSGDGGWAVAARNISREDALGELHYAISPRDNTGQIFEWPFPRPSHRCNSGRPWVGEWEIVVNYAQVLVVLVDVRNDLTAGNAKRGTRTLDRIDDDMAAGQ